MTHDHLHLSRAHVLRELEARYGSPGRIRLGHWRLMWKKTAWRLGIGLARVLKRAIDIVGSALGLMALSPLFAVTALAIWLHDRGPVFFVQKRVGQWGREFACPKFRSMVIDAERKKRELLQQNQHKDGVTFKMRSDPRITPVGRLIRKTSIDELPQLWSVLRGDMSLVGPRPPVPQEVERYSLSQRRRLDVKPGLTCIWQVEGRGDIPFEQQVEMDLSYIYSQGVWLDIWLILRTIPAVILGKGAY